MNSSAEGPRTTTKPTTSRPRDGDWLLHPTRDRSMCRSTSQHADQSQCASSSIRPRALSSLISRSTADETTWLRTKFSDDGDTEAPRDPAGRLRLVNATSSTRVTRRSSRLSRRWSTAGHPDPSNEGRPPIEIQDAMMRLVDLLNTNRVDWRWISHHHHRHHQKKLRRSSLHPPCLRHHHHLHHHHHRTNPLL